MIQGTASSVGKSVLVAALCRILRQDGYRVAPFKSQNMSLNSFVTREGGEIGRAQAVQAEAAGIEPHVDMNPILLKPEMDQRSQVVLLGKPLLTTPAREYYQHTPALWLEARAALARLMAAYEVVIIEGAGSPAEINLRDREIVNMRVAQEVGAPVLLVGDIDRGGVFASLVGTLALLEESEQKVIRGFIINKFRGDISLLQPGLEMLEERTGKPVLGVIPYYHDIVIAQEDSIFEAKARPERVEVDIAVLYLPRISNSTDFEPLQQEEGVRVRYVRLPEELGRPDLVIVPGTKSTIADLVHLREKGLVAAVLRLVQEGT
ncbi:MAG: cobyric acid synthase, partial [Dehalococcoidia bacterium]|nr:cobyric acid synthase [Dehalococcoidia bacterium]